MTQPTDVPATRPRTARSGRARLSLELTALRDDVAQLEGLLDDAAGRLLSTFEAIDLLSRHVGAVAREPGPRPDVAAALGSQVAQAATALQFHDIASQILRRVDARIDALGDLACVGRTVAGPDRTGRHRGIGRVEQTNMAVGPAELF